MTKTQQQLNVLASNMVHYGLKVFLLYTDLQQTKFNKENFNWLWCIGLFCGYKHRVKSVKTNGAAADVPVAEPQVPQSDVGVVATGEQLSWRLKHHVQHTCSSTELGTKRKHALGPGGDRSRKVNKGLYWLFTGRIENLKFNIWINRAALTTFSLVFLFSHGAKDIWQPCSW